MIRLVVTGTDTGIGKTVLSAAIAATAEASYWKPIQTGLADGEDGEAVMVLGVRQVHPSTYCLTTAVINGRCVDETSAFGFSLGLTGWQTWALSGMA